MTYRLIEGFGSYKAAEAVAALVRELGCSVSIRSATVTGGPRRFLIRVYL